MKGPDMKRADLAAPRIVLSLALAIGSVGTLQSTAFAQEYQGTWEQQMACTPDVWRLCSEQVPDVSRIVACLRQNTPQLSNNCRAVFESQANAQQQQPAGRGSRQQMMPRARAGQPMQPAPAQPKPYDDDE
jgi:paraquat-inducible protein B